MSTNSRTVGAALTPPRGIAGSRPASLAVLQANFDVNGRSFLDNFVPFVTASLAERFEDVSCEDVHASQVRPDGDPYWVGVGIPDCSADLKTFDVDVVDCHVICVSWS